ncbi:MAG: FAD:protein FMN transferase [Mariprofundaceae bacterium]
MRQALLIIALFALSTCADEPEDVHETRFMMGTLVEFTIHSIDRPRARAAIEAAAAEMQRVEDSFTTHGNQHNTVKEFNAAPVNSPIFLADEVDRLLTLSIDIAQASNDAFTPAIGGLSQLWSFSSAKPPTAPPPPADIKRLLAGASSSQIEKIGTQWLRRHEQTQLDFGGIAKGYAIDRGIAVLRAQGISNAIINAGGDIRAIGRHGKQPWKIAIRHPREAGKIIGWIPVDGDISIVTSGDYERFFTYNGKKYHHILDPSTGMPAEKSMSVTVVAVSASLADGWSTAMFVLGPKTGMPLAENSEDIEAMWMDGDGDIHLSEGMQSMFRQQP